MKRATEGGRWVRDKETGIVTRAQIDNAKAKPAMPAPAKQGEPQPKTPTGGRGK